MRIWFQRGVWCLGWLGLSVLVLSLAVYFWSTAIMEAVLAPTLEERAGEIEIESIRLRPGGLELRLKRYEEAAFVVGGLTVTCPWSRLWSLRDGFGGRLHFEAVHLRLGTESATGAGDAPVPPAARVAELAALIDGWPLEAVEMKIDELWIEYAGRDFRTGAALSLLRGGGGDTHLTAALDGRAGGLEVRVKVLAGGGGLAVDYVGSLVDWGFFQERYVSMLAEQLAAHQAELYFSPLGDGRGFLDVSGYARWTAGRADQLSFTLLADLGASELYFANGECLLRQTSLGLASNGAGVSRAYAKGAVESVRYGSWMQSGGGWALRVDGDQLAAELRLGGALSLSLGHADWRRALDGGGSGRVYVEADAVDAGWLRALPINGVPDDLDLDMDFQLEGRGTFEGFTLAEATVETEVEIREASLAAKGLTLRGLRAKASAGVSGGEFKPQSMAMRLAEADLAGFALSDVDFTVEGQPDGRWATSPVQAAFMGGRLRVEAATVDPENLEELTLRAAVESVELAQLARAVPQFKGEISGTVSGHLVAGWRQGQMILTDGRLEVDPDAGARLRYDVDGLLTRGMSPGSSAYAQYRMAEKAFADLSLRRFRIEVFPDGNATRPFRMELFGESVQGGTTVPVDFELNVNVDDTAGLLEILRLMRQGKLDLN